MMKLEWINWKTEEKELIQVDEIVANLEEIFERYKSYMNPMVKGKVTDEVIQGGLQKEAFIIDGKSPANEVANKILSDIDEVEKMTKSLIESIKTEAIEQRNKEERQLVLEIEKKIAKDKALIEKSKEAQLKYSSLSDSNTSNNIQTVIDLTKKRIHILNNKLERLNRKWVI